MDGPSGRETVEWFAQNSKETMEMWEQAKYICEHKKMEWAQSSDQLEIPVNRSPSWNMSLTVAK